MPSAHDDAPRPQALILPGDAWRPEDRDGAGDAVREDLMEVLQFLRLRTGAAQGPEDAAKLAETDAPTLVTFDDVPALPMAAVEGAIEGLEEAPVVIGPCADGTVYLLGLGEGLPADVSRDLIAAASRSLEELVGALEAAGLEGVALPPWFRLRSGKDLSFARSLARLSNLSDEGDLDFLADRLKLWLSQGTNG